MNAKLLSFVAIATITMTTFCSDDGGIAAGGSSQTRGAANPNANEQYLAQPLLESFDNGTLTIASVLKFIEEHSTSYNVKDDDIEKVYNDAQALEQGEHHTFRRIRNTCAALYLIRPRTDRKRVQALANKLLQKPAVHEAIHFATMRDSIPLVQDGIEAAELQAQFARLETNNADLSAYSNVLRFKSKLKNLGGTEDTGKTIEQATGISATFTQAHLIRVVLAVIGVGICVAAINAVQKRNTIKPAAKSA